MLSMVLSSCLLLLLLLTTGQFSSSRADGCTIVPGVKMLHADLLVRPCGSMVRSILLGSLPAKTVAQGPEMLHAVTHLSLWLHGQAGNHWCTTYGSSLQSVACLLLATGRHWSRRRGSMQALPVMPQILAKRPASFSSLEAAMEWAVSTGMARVPSACPLKQASWPCMMAAWHAACEPVLLWLACLNMPRLQQRYSSVRSMIVRCTCICVTKLALLLTPCTACVGLFALWPRMPPQHNPKP